MPRPQKYFDNHHWRKAIGNYNNKPHHRKMSLPLLFPMARQPQTAAVFALFIFATVVTHTAVTVMARPEDSSLKNSPRKAISTGECAGGKCTLKNSSALSRLGNNTLATLPFFAASQRWESQAIDRIITNIKVKFSDSVLAYSAKSRALPVLKEVIHELPPTMRHLFDNNNPLGRLKIVLTDTVRNKKGRLITEVKGFFDPDANKIYLKIKDLSNSDIGPVFRDELMHALRTYTNVKTLGISKEKLDEMRKSPWGLLPLTGAFIKSLNFNEGDYQQIIEDESQSTKFDRAIKELGTNLNYLMRLTAKVEKQEKITSNEKKVIQRIEQFAQQIKYVPTVYPVYIPLNVYQAFTQELIIKYGDKMRPRIFQEGEETTYLHIIERVIDGEKAISIIPMKIIESYDQERAILEVQPKSPYDKTIKSSAVRLTLLKGVLFQAEVANNHFNLVSSQEKYQQDSFSLRKQIESFVLQIPKQAMAIFAGQLCKHLTKILESIDEATEEYCSFKI